MLKKYFEKHFVFDNVFQGQSKRGAEKKFLPTGQRRTKSLDRLLFLLRVTPVVCVAAFIFSFFWDFEPTDEVHLVGYTLNLHALIRIVSVSGLIGFGTSWVAIQMLFHPLHKRPIWGQGLIPAHKDRIVWSLAGGIQRNILSEELIRTRIEDSGIISKIYGAALKGLEGLLEDEEFRREIKLMAYARLKQNLSDEEVRLRFARIIDDKLEENLNSGLKGFVFKTYRRFNRSQYETMIENLLNRVPATVVQVLEELEKETEGLVDKLEDRREEIETFLTNLVLDILERVNIHHLLSRQVEHLDEGQLEHMIWSATGKQLLYIEYLGAVLGILGGLLIWQPAFMTGAYIFILGGLFILDVVLHNIKMNNLEDKNA